MLSVTLSHKRLKLVLTIISSMKAMLIDLGFMDYGKVWKLQTELVKKRANHEIPDALIIVEHDHVYTVGRKYRDESPTNIDGIPAFKVERGGLWTYHGPGQLVAYPIINLNEKGIGIADYVRLLEEAVIKTLKHFRIDGVRKEGFPGVWVRDKKICSIGIAVKHWVTFHGLALNANTDLSYFNKINPCGLEGNIMTSMAELLNKHVDMEDLKHKFLDSFSNVFKIDFYIKDVKDLNNHKGSILTIS